MKEFLNSDLAKILELGFNGLGYLLAVVAAFLLWSQRKLKLSPDYRNLLYAFMGLALALCLISAYIQLQPRPAPGLAFSWEKVGMGDITDHDILTSTPGDQPADNMCNYQNLGLTGICWPGNKSRPCRYKTIFYTQITPTTGGAPEGVVFRCVAKGGLLKQL